MMWDYLMRELSAADERRRRALVGIQTKSQLAALQDRVRRVMHSGIGPFTGRSLLRAQHVGEIAKPDYAIEKIVFESQPDYFVTANLYRPKSTAARLPAVVQSCGQITNERPDSSGLRPADSVDARRCLHKRRQRPP